MFKHILEIFLIFPNVGHPISIRLNAPMNVLPQHRLTHTRIVQSYIIIPN